MSIWCNSLDSPSWADIWDEDWVSRQSSVEKPSSETSGPIPWSSSPREAVLSQDVKAAVEEIDSIVSELWRTTLPPKNVDLQQNTEVSYSIVSNVCSSVPLNISSKNDVNNMDTDNENQIPNSSELVRVAFVNVVDSIQQSVKTDVTDNKPKFKCDRCDKCYVWRNDLVKHLKVHSGNRHNCPQCHKSYVLRSDLLKHQRSHNSEKSFHCKHCGKLFSSTSDLQKHVRTHTGERPYFCNVCDKSFSASDNFSKHLKIHSGDKPLSCPDCGQKFLKKSNLLQHKRIHRGEKPFQCEICGLSFTQKTHLKTHLSTHSGLKPYFCTSCDQRFTRNADLKRHMKRCHSERSESRGL